MSSLTGPGPSGAARYLPGLALSGAVALAAWGLQRLETAVVGQPLVEGLVLAILVGMAVRASGRLGPGYAPGIGLAARQVLEVAIVLLGISIDLGSVLRAGPTLLAVIVVVVVAGILASRRIGRAAGLGRELATLVAVGNSICGNSAIAAVAPVIGADRKDVAAAVSLTAVVGVALVLALPLVVPIAGLTAYQYGVLSGLTVYAVPQVLAATAPLGRVATDAGTLVKLVRVLMLGPVVAWFALRNPVRRDASRLPLGRFVPWFVAGFMLLATARSIGLVPAALAEPLREASRYLTLVAMAALGLDTDLGVVRHAARPVAVAVVCSLAVLLVVSLGLILGLRIGA